MHILYYCTYLMYVLTFTFHHLSFFHLREVYSLYLHWDTMLTSMIVCWLTLCLIQHTSGLVNGNLHLEDAQPSLRRTEPSFLLDIGQLYFNIPHSSVIPCSLSCHMALPQTHGTGYWHAITGSFLHLTYEVNVGYWASC